MFNAKTNRKIEKIYTLFQMEKSVKFKGNGHLFAILFTAS